MKNIRLNINQNSRTLVKFAYTAVGEKTDGLVLIALLAV